MPNSLQKPERTKKDRFLYSIILLLLFAFLTVLFVHFTAEPQIVTIYEQIKRVSNGNSVPLPQEISKGPILTEAEETLRVVREIVESGDGKYIVSAHLEGGATLGDSVVLQDFVEDIRFNERVVIVSGNVIAKNGTLFPPSHDLNISSYGPGPIDERFTSINIAILDINFSNKSDDTELYEFVIEFDGEVDEILFDGAEFRFGKYILELDEEKYAL